jgi:hypothetical protein
MKKFSYLLALIATGATVLASCNKEKTPVYAEVPINKVSVTSGDETIVGAVDDVNRTVTFTFNNAENFTNCNITIDVNDGWALTYPKSLTGVDLQSTPTFNFTDPNNAIVKYSVKFSSNAFPIVNPQKIQIKGLNEGEDLTVDNTTKTIKIAFDEEKMDFNNIELVFNDGALQTGATLPASLVFDFAQGNSQPLVINLGGERTYFVILDASKYMKATPEQLGFLDVSVNFATADQPWLKVYAAEAVQALPIPCVSTSIDTNWDWAPDWGMNLYGSANPRAWEIATADGNHYDVGHLDDIFSFPGDWTGDRGTMNCFGKIVIVTVDASKVKADLVASADPVDPVAQQAVVATSGWTRTDALDYLIKDAGNVIFPGKDWLYRAAITVDDGTLGFATPALKGDKYYDLPFQTEAPYAPDDDEAVKAAAHESLMNSATTEITASDMAWVCGWLVRNGKSMGVHDLINNDHSGYVSDNGVLGMGWSTNFYNVHNLVGITYDGKIAFMINEAGFSNWDGQPGYVDVDNGWEEATNAGFNYRGYSLKQMAWMAQRLGWRNAAALGNSFGEAPDFLPSLVVNGKSVIEGVTPTSTSYVVTVKTK